MKAKINVLLSVLVVASTIQAFAADVTTGSKSSGVSASTGSSSVSTNSTSVSDKGISTGETELDSSMLDTDTTSSSSSSSSTSKSAKSNSSSSTSTGTDSTSSLDMNAAGKTIQVSPKGGVGNYKEVTCDKEYFSSNACNQCFEGGNKAVGEKITGLTDSWTNPNSTEQVIYKDEQKMPEMINLGSASKTTWTSNPTDTSKFWSYADEIVWVDSATGTGKLEFVLEGNKKINFLESDLGASYLLSSTEAKENDPVGLLKFSLNYHDTDDSAKEGALKTHNECVVFLAGKQPEVKPVVVQTPKEVTKVKTGPESIFLVLAAMLLAFGLMKYRKKA